MTNKEAYQLIESCLEYDKDMSDYPERYEEAIRIAKEVFDKQEPMKSDEHGWDSPCPNCGQKLGWEE